MPPPVEGPWVKYQRAAASAGEQGPWVKYQTAGAQGFGGPTMPPAQAAPFLGQSRTPGEAGGGPLTAGAAPSQNWWSFTQTPLSQALMQAFTPPGLSTPGSTAAPNHGLGGAIQGGYEGTAGGMGQLLSNILGSAAGDVASGNPGSMLKIPTEALGSMGQGALGMVEGLGPLFSGGDNMRQGTAEVANLLMSAFGLKDAFDAGDAARENLNQRATDMGRAIQGHVGSALGNLESAAHESFGHPFAEDQANIAAGGHGVDLAQVENKLMDYVTKHPEDKAAANISDAMAEPLTSGNGQISLEDAHNVRKMVDSAIRKGMPESPPERGVALADARKNLNSAMDQHAQSTLSPHGAALWNRADSTFKELLKARSATDPAMEAKNPSALSSQLTGGGANMALKVLSNYGYDEDRVASMLDRMNRDYSAARPENELYAPSGRKVASPNSKISLGSVTQPILEKTAGNALALWRSAADAIPGGPQADVAPGLPMGTPPEAEAGAVIAPYRPASALTPGIRSMLLAATRGNQAPLGRQK